MATTEEQVSWNLSARISDQINNLLCSGRRCCINGNELQTFFYYKEIRMLINHHLKKEEVKQVNDLEKKINYVTIKLKRIKVIEEDEFEFDDNAQREKNIKIKIILLKNRRILLVEKYRKIVLKLLDDYGYLMERKQDSSHME